MAAVVLPIAGVPGANEATMAGLANAAYAGAVERAFGSLAASHLIGHVLGFCPSASAVPSVRGRHLHRGALGRLLSALPTGLFRRTPRGEQVRK